MRTGERFSAILFVAWILSGANPPISAQETIEFSLDIYYADPANSATSSGSWELIGLTTGRGLSGASVRTANVASSPVFLAPTGTGTDVPEAGFRESFGSVSFAIDRSDHYELLFNQVPVNPPGSQGIFYDVGVPGGATQPGENGTPPISGFQGTNVPWDFDDLLGDFIDDGIQNGSGLLSGSVRLAIGSFSVGAIPAFYSQQPTTGNVFTLLGTATDPPPQGSILEASVVLHSRANTGTIAGDVNLDGTVDGLDFLVWNSHKFSATPGWTNGDLNGDLLVDGPDFLLWNENKFTSVERLKSVPEPITTPWILLVAVLIFRGRPATRRCLRERQTCGVTFHSFASRF